MQPHWDAYYCELGLARAAGLKPASPICHEPERLPARLAATFLVCLAASSSFAALAHLIG